MTATHIPQTRPRIELPAASAAAAHGAARRLVSIERGESAPQGGQPSQAAVGVERPRRSFLPPERSRPNRPLQTGGQPPTVIRNLDALFAADQRKREVHPSHEREELLESGVQPIDRAAFARALLYKVATDFARPSEPVAPVSPPVASRAAQWDEETSPKALMSSVAKLSQRDIPTEELPLDADDADVMALVPWYERLWNKLVGR